MSIKDRLENWKRFAKSSPRPPVSCRSLESRYKPPPCWHPVILSWEVDLLDAWEVEKAIIALDELDRKIIVYAWIRPGHDFEAFCRKHKIRGSRHLSQSETFNMVQSEAERRLEMKLNDCLNVKVMV
jgi:hypothetical protein